MTLYMKILEYSLEYSYLIFLYSQASTIRVLLSSPPHAFPLAFAYPRGPFEECFPISVVSKVPAFKVFEEACSISG